jgi:pilus assembly protein Flp/PilA
MRQLWKNIQQFLRDEEGVTAIEYALIAALIAIVIIVGVRFVGEEVNETFTTIGNELNGVNNT